MTQTATCIRPDTFTIYDLTNGFVLNVPPVMIPHPAPTSLVHIACDDALSLDADPGLKSVRRRRGGYQHRTSASG